MKKKWIIWGIFWLSVIGLIVLYGCESQVLSLSGNGSKVNREELQIELETMMATARIRIVDLDRQDALRNLVLQNGLVLMQGQPLNPIGLITAIAAIYGVGSAGISGTRLIKKKVINP